MPRSRNRRKNKKKRSKKTKPLQKKKSEIDELFSAMNEIPNQKISAIVLEYGKIILDQCESIEQIKSTMAFIILCWNIACLEKSQILEKIQETVEKLGPEIEEEMIMMIKRKLELFDHIQFLIVKSDLTFDNGTMRLTVSAQKALD